MRNIMLFRDLMLANSFRLTESGGLNKFPVNDRGDPSLS
jgi:hypothetical protein